MDADHGRIQMDHHMRGVLQDQLLQLTRRPQTQIEPICRLSQYVRPAYAPSR